MAKKQTWVNANMSEELRQQFDQMARDDGRSASSMVRWLIYSELNRRREVEEKVSQTENTTN